MLLTPALPLPRLFLALAPLPVTRHIHIHTHYTYTIASLQILVLLLYIMHVTKYNCTLENCFSCLKILSTPHAVLNMRVSYPCSSFLAGYLFGSPSGQQWVTSTLRFPITRRIVTTNPVCTT